MNEVKAEHQGALWTSGALDQSAAGSNKREDMKGVQQAEQAFRMLQIYLQIRSRVPGPKVDFLKVFFLNKYFIIGVTVLRTVYFTDFFHLFTPSNPFPLMFMFRV